MTLGVTLFNPVQVATVYMEGRLCEVECGDWEPVSTQNCGKLLHGRGRRRMQSPHRDLRKGGQRGGRRNRREGRSGSQRSRGTGKTWLQWQQFLSRDGARNQSPVGWRANKILRVPNVYELLISCHLFSFLWNCSYNMVLRALTREDFRAGQDVFFPTSLAEKWSQVQHGSSSSLHPLFIEQPGLNALGITNTTPISLTQAENVKGKEKCIWPDLLCVGGNFYPQLPIWLRKFLIKFP